MSRIQVIQPEDAEGRLKEIYTEIIQKRGQLAEVHKIQSLRPESIVKKNKEQRAKNKEQRATKSKEQRFLNLEVV